MSSHSASSLQLNLQPTDNSRLANLCGPCNEHLSLLEKRLGIDIAQNGHQLQLTGTDAAIHLAAQIIQQLFKAAITETLTPHSIHLSLQEPVVQEPMHTEHSTPLDNPETASDSADTAATIQTRRMTIKARGTNQRRYLKAIQAHDVNFGIGPAGTGKTYLAVACAVAALEQERVRRLILARPAVEAGEKLGFLPGDLAQKVDPYLRPLYDALYEMLGFEQVTKLIERNIIEVAPLAFMRGRTLNDSFIILDEAQNTTPEQIKMFLTRIGFGSKAVITGDITQIDLPKEKQSGLKQVLDILQNIEGISFTFFGTRDVVRHELVQRIVAAYETHS